jgi:hypothetical protein
MNLLMFHSLFDWVAGLVSVGVCENVTQEKRHNQGGMKVIYIFNFDLTPLHVCHLLTKVRIYDEINSEPSGGTLETVFHSLNDRYAQD